MMKTQCDKKGKNGDSNNMAKKTIELTYQEETDNNEKIFKELVKRVRPDLYVILDLLDETGINVLILLKYMRQLNNIAVGNGYGEIITEIVDKNVTFIRGVESDRLQIPVIEKKSVKGFYQNDPS